MSNSTGIDKDAHYGRYQKQEDARNKLGMKLAYKSLDIPEDDMNINVRNVHHHAAPMSGMAGNLAKAAIGAGLLATGIGAPLGGWMIAQALLKPAVEKVITQPGVNRDANVNATATIEMPE